MLRGGVFTPECRCITLLWHLGILLPANSPVSMGLPLLWEMRYVLQNAYKSSLSGQRPPAFSLPQRPTS